MITTVNNFKNNDKDKIKEQLNNLFIRIVKQLSK